VDLRRPECPDYLVVQRDLEYLEHQLLPGDQRRPENQRLLRDQLHLRHPRDQQVQSRLRLRRDQLHLRHRRNLWHQ